MGARGGWTASGSAQVQQREANCAPLGGAAVHRLGEVHVAHAILERGQTHRLGAADRTDELGLDPPGVALAVRDGDLLQLPVAATAAAEPRSGLLEPQRAFAAEQPQLRTSAQ